MDNGAEDSPVFVCKIVFISSVCGILHRDLSMAAKCYDFLIGNMHL